MISLSNLLKQCFVISHENEKRIINADERYIHNSAPANTDAPNNGEKERVPGNEEILDGFLAGLEAEEVVSEPQITAEELLEQARTEAEGIVAAAKAEALQITEAAQKEAELLFQKRKAEGYNEGVSKMNDELGREKKRMQEEFMEMEHRLKSEYHDKMQTMETDIVDAIIAVFHRVFDIQFDDKKQILLYLVNNTLMNEESGKDFRIRVASANYKFMESHIKDIKEKIGNDINIEIVGDMSLGPEDCMIETGSGVFNCGIDMELANLEKDIRSLCG